LVWAEGVSSLLTVGCRPNNINFVTIQLIRHGEVDEGKLSDILLRNPAGVPNPSENLQINEIRGTAGRVFSKSKGR